MAESSFWLPSKLSLHLYELRHSVDGRSVIVVSRRVSNADSKPCYALKEVSHLNDSFLHSWMWNQVVAFISSGGSSYNVVDVYVMPHIINWGALQCCKKRFKVAVYAGGCKLTICNSANIVDHNSVCAFCRLRKRELWHEVVVGGDAKYLAVITCCHRKILLLWFWKQSRLNYLFKIWTQTPDPNYLCYRSTWKPNFENQ